MIVNNIIKQIFPPINKWKWSLIINPAKFTWNTEITPFSGFKSVIWLLIIYLSLIAILKLIMKNRKPIQLNWLIQLNNKILFFWTSSLALTSGIVVFKRITKSRLVELYCENPSTTLGIWPYLTYMYFLNKVYQLSGSLILTLQKKPIKYYHLWRHIYVIPMVYSWLADKMIYSTLATLVNSFVHSFLYFYYWKLSVGQERTVFYKNYIIFFQTFQFIASFTLCIPFIYIYILVNIPISFWGNEKYENLKCSGIKAFIITLIGNIFFFVGFIRVHIKDLRFLKNNSLYKRYLAENMKFNTSYPSSPVEFQNSPTTRSKSSGVDSSTFPSSPSSTSQKYPISKKNIKKYISTSSSSSLSNSTRKLQHKKSKESSSPLL